MLASLPLKSELSVLDALARARKFMDSGKSTATKKAYAGDWAHFTAWCSQHRCQFLPAEPPTVAAYIADLALTMKPATIQRRLAAIGQAHQVAGLESPTTTAPVRECWKGIRRTLSISQDKAAPLLVMDLRDIVSRLDLRTLLGLRDRALLCLGFAAALRRSELVALDVEDVEIRPEGLVLSVRRGKTDQEGQGRRIGIAVGRTELCPVAAVHAWRVAAGINDSALFRSVTRHGAVGARLSDRAVDLVVRRHSNAARLAGDYSAHSLRAGLATSAAQAGLSERDIAAQTGHRSLAVLRGYIREGELFRSNVTASLGL